MPPLRRPAARLGRLVQGPLSTLGSPGDLSNRRFRAELWSKAGRKVLLLSLAALCFISGILLKGSKTAPLGLSKGILLDAKGLQNRLNPMMSLLSALCENLGFILLSGFVDLSLCLQNGLLQVLHLIQKGL